MKENETRTEKKKYIKKNILKNIEKQSKRCWLRRNSCTYTKLTLVIFILQRLLRPVPSCTRGDTGSQLQATGETRDFPDFPPEIVAGALFPGRERRRMSF